MLEATNRFTRREKFLQRTSRVFPLSVKVYHENTDGIGNPLPRSIWDPLFSLGVKLIDRIFCHVFSEGLAGDRNAFGARRKRGLRCRKVSARF